MTSGSNFTVLWTKHYLDDDHFKLEFEATIFKNGSIVFVYHNLVTPLLETGSHWPRDRREKVSYINFAHVIRMLWYFLVEKESTHQFFWSPFSPS